MSEFVKRAVTAAILTALPLGALAQTSTFFTPPKLLAQGTASAPVAGKGAVTVQVYVKKDGSFQVVRVIKSTNPGDNAAALEIAKSSRYKTALRDGVKVDAYYDYTMRFDGSSVAAAAGGSPLADADALIRNGKYDAAKAQLQTYLAAHPSDTEANTLLGVADAFNNDPAGAAAAFDKAGTIAPKYRPLAAQAYAKAGAADLTAQNAAGAVTAAGHAVDLDPNNVNGYSVRANGYLAQGNFASALPDLEKTRSMAQSAHLDDKAMAVLDYNLMSAYLGTGNIDAAVPLSKDAVRLDPSLAPKVNQSALNAIMNAAAAQQNAGKQAEAVARLESGAAAFPADAGALYGQAAMTMANATKADWKKVKAEADKALAADPSDGIANYIAGIASSQNGDNKAALAYMTKAKASAYYGTDPTFAKRVDDSVKQLNALPKS